MAPAAAVMAAFSVPAASGIRAICVKLGLFSALRSSSVGLSVSVSVSLLDDEDEDVEVVDGERCFVLRPLSGGVLSPEVELLSSAVSNAGVVFFSSALVFLLLCGVFAVEWPPD